MIRMLQNLDYKQIQKITVTVNLLQILAQIFKYKADTTRMYFCP
jgi:hypothetical protein